MIRNAWVVARFLCELAYDIAREALRPQPIPHRAPVKPARDSKPTVWN
jgi:hypothetical protein